MRVLHVIAAGVATVVMMSVATAQAPRKPVPAPGTAMKTAPAAGATKIVGPVKGLPTGKTFVISVPRTGPVTVDASKATVRNHGSFARVSDLKGGAFVQATGTMAGTTLSATEVNILRIPGEKRMARKGAAATKPMGKK